MDVVNQLMPTLTTYPLYPYLQYRQITDDLMNQPALVVTNFIAANPTPVTSCLAPGAPPASRIRWPTLNAFAWR